MSITRLLGYMIINSLLILVLNNPEEQCRASPTTSDLYNKPPGKAHI